MLCAPREHAAGSSAGRRDGKMRENQKHDVCASDASRVGFEAAIRDADLVEVSTRF